MLKAPFLSKFCQNQDVLSFFWYLTLIWILKFDPYLDSEIRPLFVFGNVTLSFPETPKSWQVKSFFRNTVLLNAKFVSLKIIIIAWKRINKSVTVKLMTNHLEAGERLTSEFIIIFRMPRRLKFDFYDLWPKLRFWWFLTKLKFWRFLAKIAIFTIFQNSILAHNFDFTWISIFD
mgnify:CR=1 FL=1